ncbi:MAG: tRNA lysidine(34) synthetase TilS [Pseudomonadota bacterium]
MPPTSAAELTPATVARFARDLAGLVELESARVLVAVSGGPDSLALLFLTHAVLGDRCSGATVDHGLRPESADEARWVGALCARHGIAHTILRDTVPPRVAHTANLSARARDLRYRLLGEHAEALGGALIATAHHADDQLETLIMRLNRGSGLAGLAGVRARKGNVIRPLLDWRHAELVAIVAALGIAAIDDPSNVSDRFDRARLRKALAGIDWLDVGRIGASARALSDAEDALGWIVDRLKRQRVRKQDGSVVLAPADLPFEIRRRLVERCVVQIDPQADIRGAALVRTVRALEAGERTMIGDVVGETGADGHWRFTKAPPRRSV